MCKIDGFGIFFMIMATLFLIFFLYWAYKDYKNDKAIIRELDSYKARGEKVPIEVKRRMLRDLTKYTSWAGL